MVLRQTAGSQSVLHRDCKNTQSVHTFLTFDSLLNRSRNFSRLRWNFICSSQTLAALSQSWFAWSWHAVWAAADNSCGAVVQPQKDMRVQQQVHFWAFT